MVKVGTASGGGTGKGAVRVAIFHKKAVLRWGEEGVPCFQSGWVPFVQSVVIIK